MSNSIMLFWGSPKYVHNIFKLTTNDNQVESDFALLKNEPFIRVLPQFILTLLIPIQSFPLSISLSSPQKALKIPFTCLC